MLVPLAQSDKTRDNFGKRQDDREEENNSADQLLTVSEEPIDAFNDGIFPLNKTQRCDGDGESGGSGVVDDYSGDSDVVDDGSGDCGDDGDEG